MVYFIATQWQAWTEDGIYTITSARAEDVTKDKRFHPDRVVYVIERGYRAGARENIGIRACFDDAQEIVKREAAKRAKRAA